MFKELKILALVSTFILCGVVSLYAVEPGKDVPYRSDLKPLADKHPAGISASPHPCSACHRFDEEKFKELVRVPDIKVLSSEMVGGFWQVSYELQGGRNNIAYASLVFDTIIYGQMVHRDGKSVTQAVPPAFPPKADISNLPVRDALYVMGNKDARKRIFVFYDFDCPSCAKQHADLKAFLADHNDYAAYVMVYPSNVHTKAEDTSKAVYCMGENLFVREAIAEKVLSDLLNNKKTDMALARPECDISGFERMRRYGADVLRIDETPVLVLPDGNVQRRPVSKKDLEDMTSGGMPEKTKPTSSLPSKGGLL